MDERSVSLAWHEMMHIALFASSASLDDPRVVEYLECFEFATPTQRDGYLKTLRDETPGRVASCGGVRSFVQMLTAPLRSEEERQTSYRWLAHSLKKDETLTTADGPFLALVREVLRVEKSSDETTTA